MLRKHLLLIAPLWVQSLSRSHRWSPLWVFISAVLNCEERPERKYCQFIQTSRVQRRDMLPLSCLNVHSSFQVVFEIHLLLKACFVWAIFPCRTQPIKNSEENKLYWRKKLKQNHSILSILNSLLSPVFPLCHLKYCSSLGKKKIFLTQFLSSLVLLRKVMMS